MIGNMLEVCSFFPQSFPIIESRKEPIAMQNYWNVSDNGLSSICGLKDLACLKNASSTLKSLYYASLADVEVMKLLQKKGIDCNCPAGESFYYVNYGSSIIASKVCQIISVMKTFQEKWYLKNSSFWHFNSPFVFKTTETPVFMFSLLRLFD